MSHSINMAKRSNEIRLILVTGATGNQGGAVIRHLREKGFAVRALTRDPDKVRSPGADQVYALQPAVESGAGEQPERNGSDRKRKTLRELTEQEREALSKVETGYVRRDEEGNLLIVDDTNYFRHMREEAEAVKRGTDAELREVPE